jgi:short-subunit dehydrogenase
VSLKLAGSSALLTGASGGLGRAIARELCANGVSLTLSGRRAELLEPVAAELRTRSIVCDLSDRADVERLAAACPDVDLLVANAALPATGELTGFTAEQIDKLLEINLRAPIALAHHFLPGMLDRRRGQLVFIASLSAKAASPKSSLYSATKFGLRGFALGLREDLHGSGVGVSLVLPGFISGAGMFADAAVRLPPGIGKRTPEQVASAVLDAVAHDRAEVTVAPALVRIGTGFALLAPGPAAALQRLLGSHRVANEFVKGQLDKRP